MTTRIRVVEIETDDPAVLAGALDRLGWGSEAPDPAKALPAPQAAQDAATDKDAPNPASATSNGPTPSPARPRGKIAKKTRTYKPRQAKQTEKPKRSSISQKNGSHSSPSNEDVKSEPADSRGPMYHTVCGAAKNSWVHREQCLGQKREDKRAKPSVAPTPPTSSAVASEQPISTHRYDQASKDRDPGALAPPTPPEPAEAEPEDHPAEEAPVITWPEHDGADHKTDTRIEKGYSVTRCETSGRCPFIRILPGTHEIKIDFFTTTKCLNCRDYKNSPKHLSECIAGPRLRLGPAQW